ncbi:MAG: DUF5694 domain-containing protein, partial [Bacteroidia bacterium]
NLAKRLNIKELEYIDNMQDETILGMNYPEFFEDYQASQDAIGKMIAQASVFEDTDRLTANCIKNNNLLPLYKFMNSEKYMKEDYRGQWELWLRTNFKSKTDRSRYSLWEMRNLQITAHIMRLVAKYPEKKIVIVIGASHKSFIEKHLSQMPDIELLRF